MSPPHEIRDLAQTRATPPHRVPGQLEKHGTSFSQDLLTAHRGDRDLDVVAQLHIHVIRARHDRVSSCPTAESREVSLGTAPDPFNYTGELLFEFLSLVQRNLVTVVLQPVLHFLAPLYSQRSIPGFDTCRCVPQHTLDFGDRRGRPYRLHPGIKVLD